MLTDTMISFLKRQIEHELSNSAIYQKIAMWLDIKGFSNISNYYKDWSLEEKDHAMWVQEFLEGLNIFVSISDIKIPNLDLDSNVTNFVNVTYDTEMLTTKMLEECLEESYKGGNTTLVTVFLLNKMLDEQIEETAKANKIKDTINNIGDNLALLQIFDSNFGN